MDDQIALLKAEGTSKLQEGDYPAAIAKYEEVLKLLPESHEQYIAVNGNKALACMKAEQWQEGASAAECALRQLTEEKLAAAGQQLQLLYQKLLFRKGVCEQSLGRYSGASQCFESLVKADPANVEAKRRLAQCTHSLSKMRNKFSGMFAPGASLYDDRVRQTESAKQKELEEYNKSEAKDTMSFEEWREQRATEEAEVRKEKQKKNKPKLLRSNNSAVQLELDEEDKQILSETKNKGYCYFRRELTEEEKRAKDELHVPQKLDATESTASETPVAVPASPPRGVSTWNNGSTYEEKDTTAWCQALLRELLPAQRISLGADRAVELAAVEDLRGDAQIMVVRGSLRHFFDFSATFKFSVVDGGGVELGSGELLSDSLSGAVNSLVDPDYLKGSRVRWTGALSANEREEIRTRVCAHLNDQLSEFHKQFKLKR